MSDYDDLKKRRSRRYSDPEKESIINDFLKSEKTIKEYCEHSECSEASLARWIRESKKSKGRKGTRQFSSPEQRKEAVEAFLKSGMSIKMFAKTWGMNDKTLSKWLLTYKRKGAKGLEPGHVYGSGKKKGPKGIKNVVRGKILEVKSSFPDFGLKKLQLNLKRFQGISVSPNTIKKVLLENDSYEPQRSERVRRSPPQIRRFERANPMQLWQSDITSYVLGRHRQRVYLVVFMDDNSRYIVSWGLALKQTGSFVIETLFDGLGRFGKPEEILTDQGRQYFSWRGKSEFQKLLHRESIKHVVSRSHHPQTLGKCERFWKTVGKEFWDRANPKDLADARERFKHFVNHYNHFRPHQGIGGMIPADRFFGLESEIKEKLEATLQENELRMAIDQGPRKPLFFIGQIGDQKLTMHGEQGKVVVNTPCGSSHQFDYEELGHKKLGEDNGEQYNYSNKLEEEARQAQKDDDIYPSSDSGERTLGSSERRGARERTEECSGDFGVLDGNDDEDRSWREVGNNSLKSVADESASTIGNVRRTVETTEEKEDELEQRRRSEISFKEDQRTGENDRDAESFDRDSEINAWLSRSETSREEDIRREEWEENQEGTTQSSEKEWDNGYFKKEEE